MSRPIDNLRAAYADIEQQGSDPEQDARVASGFVRNEQYENYVDMSTQDPEAFAKLPRQTRMSAGFYESARDAARRIGRTA